MSRNPALANRTLIEECAHLLREARLAAERPPAGAESSRQVRRALALVASARRSLRGQERGREAAGDARLGRSVGGIVERVLRRPDRVEREPRAGASAEATPPAAWLLNGHTRTVSIADLLSFLQVQRKSGRLRVVCPAEVITVYFHRGDLVGAVSSCSPPGCLLGEILVEQGALLRQELESFLVFHTRGRGQLGKALRVDTLVTEEQLRAGLTCQIQRLFHRLLAAEEALFEFREGAVEDDPAGARLSVAGLLLESARLVDEREQVAAPPSEEGARSPSPARTAAPAAAPVPPPLPTSSKEGACDEDPDWLRRQLRKYQEDEA